MARHLTDHPDPALVWADANLGQPEAAAQLDEHRANIERRREYRNHPEPVELDEYDDDLDIDDWTGPLDTVEAAPGPVGVAAHLSMAPGPVVPALASPSGPASLSDAAARRPATPPSGLSASSDSGAR